MVPSLYLTRPMSVGFGFCVFFRGEEAMYFGSGEGADLCSLGV